MRALACEAWCVAGDYVDFPSVAPLKRHDTVRAPAELEPLQQRVAC